MRRFLQLALVLLLGVTLPTPALGQSHAAIVNTGGTTVLNYDIPNSYAYCTPFTPSVNSTVDSAHVWWDAPGAGTWGTAFYTDASGVPGSLMSGATSGSTPSSHWNTLTPTGVGTLSAGTQYWICAAAASATMHIGMNGYDGGGHAQACANGKSTVYSAAPLGSPFSTWPSTFPSIGGDTGNCYAFYAALSYTSTSPIDLVSVSTGACLTVGASCTYTIAPTGSNHSLLVYVSYGGGTYTPTSVTDSASDSIAIRGTCPAGVGSDTLAECFASIDRVTTGVTTVTVNFAAGLHYGFAVAEVAGTAASSSFDQVEYDTAETSTPFTSGATGTTAQATEFLFGGATTHAPGMGTFAGTNGWTVLYNSAQNGVSDYGFAIFSRVVTNGPSTYTLQGTQSNSGPYNLLGLAAFKAGSQSYTAPISETQSTSDALARSAAFGRGDTESNSTSDALARMANYGRGPSETNSSSDNLARLGAFGRGDTESNAASDALARLGTFAETADESSLLADLLSAVAPTGYLAVMSDALSLSDALGRVGTFTRVSLQTSTAADALTSLAAQPAKWVKKQTKYGVLSSTTSISVTFDSALSNPSLIVAGIYVLGSGSLGTPTDTANNTYIDCGVGAVPWRSSNYRLELFYALNTSTTSSNTITETYGGSNTQMRIYSAELTGRATSSPLDACSSTANGTTPGDGSIPNMSTPEVTPSLNGELIVGFAGTYNNNPSSGPGFASLLYGLLEYQVQPLAGSIAATWTRNATDWYAGIVATFKPALQSYTAKPAQTQTASDSLARAASFVRGDTETNTASDTLARVAAFGRGVGEANTASDNLASQGGHFANLAETNTAADALARLGAFARTAAEINTASDTLAENAGYLRALIERDTTSDTLVRTLAAIRGVAENLVLDDSLKADVVILVQGRHQFTLPGKSKAGSVPGKAKTGEAPVH